MPKDALPQDLRNLMLSSRAGRTLSWVILAAGLSFWVLLQSYLVSGPLAARNQLPEVDDSLAYLARTQVEKQCPDRDCEALTSLHAQFSSMVPDPEILRQSEIAGFAFPLYHPLFSELILLADRLNNDLITTYRALWKLSPLFTGIAMACFLSSLWGRSVAGIILFIAAFKIFPGGGLHYFTPTTLVLAVSMLIWARIIARNGYAPLTLIAGSVVLSALHPLGMLFSLTAMLISLLLADRRQRKKLGLLLLLLGLVCLLLLIFTSVADRLQIYNTVAPAHLFAGLKTLVATVAGNLTETGIQFTRFKDTLFGPLYILVPAIVLGIHFLERERRRKATVFFSILSAALLCSLFHTHALTPDGALFFRFFIPFQLALIGIPAHLFLFTAKRLLHQSLSTGEQSQEPRPVLTKLSNTLVIAVLAAYAAEIIIAGVIQIQITRDYMTRRQPLHFSESQPRLLLAEARPSDRILYGSTMAMASYFVQGAMKLGALYYHPVFSGSEEAVTYLQQENPRFAVFYNPGVYHPAYTGLDEKNRCITSLELAPTPLSKTRPAPLNREGVIPAKLLHWLDISPQTDTMPQTLRVYVINPGPETMIQLLPLPVREPWSEAEGTNMEVDAHWSGWLSFSLAGVAAADSYRLVTPPGDSALAIGGLSFEDSHLRWPWTQKAIVSLNAKDPETGHVTLSFDPADLLPRQLQDDNIIVLDDLGSTVLLELPGR